MTDYSDLPEVNALFTEQQQVEAAISNIDNGGTLTSITVGPPPPQPGPPPLTPMSPIMIMLADPSAALVDAARAALVQRSDEISAELAALGVTDTPPARGA